MAVIKVIKNRNYTTIGKYHLKEKDMSLKAIGLLSIMLSLPEDWDYSVNGLSSIRKESRNTINEILKELEKFGYLQRTRLRDSKGKITDVEYLIYESPYPKNQDMENQDIDFCIQYNTKEYNNLNNNKKEIYKERYGEFNNVLLTAEEYAKLEKSNLLPYIEKLSSYIASKGKKYKSHYATILNWSRSDIKEKVPEWFDKTIEQDSSNDKELEELKDWFNNYE